MLCQVASILLISQSEAKSAELRETGNCVYKLTGTIQSGDTDKLSGLGCTYLTLVLDSPGGNVGEALKIARGLYRTTTVVEAEQDCLSACALIFMAGRMCSGAPYHCGVSRQMHPTARLGFHAPFIDASAPDKMVSLHTTFSQTVSIISAIQSTFSELTAIVRSTGGKQDLLPMDLFANMLATPPQEFYVIDTDDKAYSFGIGIEETIPEGRVLQLQDSHLFMMCYNLMFEHYRGWTQSEFGFSDYFQFDPGRHERQKTSFEPAGELQDVVWYDKGRIIADLRLQIEWGSIHPGWCRVSKSHSPAYFDVSFFKTRSTNGEDFLEPRPIPSKNDIPTISTVLHYSMGFPLNTKIASLQWDQLREPDADIRKAANYRQVGSPSLAAVRAQDSTRSEPKTNSVGIREDHCAPIVASRPDVVQVFDYIRNFPSTEKWVWRVYDAGNGWFAISSNFVLKEKADSALAQLKLENRIPEDAFCSSGATFRAKMMGP